MQRLRTLLAILLVASAVAFAVGALVERSAPSEGGPIATSSEAGGETHTESGTEMANEGLPAGETHAEAPSGEALFGVNPEASAVVIVAVVLSLMLALAVWKVPGKAPVVIALVVGLLAAALDVREIVHQAQESRAGLVAIAAVVCLLHLGVALVAILALRDRPTPAEMPEDV